MATEKSPLLGSQTSGDLSEYRDEGTSENVYVPLSADELPPPYSSLENGSQMISCKVCSSMIDISGKGNQHVVKCSNCNEATPIKPAPPGKKYVRCPCNCLLICKAVSGRIACPRQECKRIINLAPTTITTSQSTIPGMCQVRCAHCHNLFLFNTLNNSLARCPHCRKVSSVGIYFARRRAILFLTIALIIFVVAAIVTGTSYRLAAKSGGYYVIFIGLPIAALIFFIQSLRFCTMKVSTIEGSA